MFVLYPESQQRAIEYAQKNFPCAWALHDKDVHAEKDYSKYLDKYGEPPEWKAGDLKKPFCVQFSERAVFLRYCKRTWRSGSDNPQGEQPV